MQTEVNEINKRLKIQFEENGWDKILNPFIDSKHYEKISDRLIESVQQQNHKYEPCQEKMQMILFQFIFMRSFHKSLIQGLLSPICDMLGSIL